MSFCVFKAIFKISFTNTWWRLLLHNSWALEKNFHRCLSFWWISERGIYETTMQDIVSSFKRLEARWSSNIWCNKRFPWPNKVKRGLSWKNILFHQNRMDHCYYKVHSVIWIIPLSCYLDHCYYNEQRSPTYDDILMFIRE